MRNPFSPRAFVLLVLGLLLASTLPAPTSGVGHDNINQPAPPSGSQLWDMRIVSVKPVVKAGATPGNDWATHGWFPEPNSHIQFEVTLRVFQSQQSDTGVAFNGPIRIRATPSDGFPATWNYPGCFDNGRTNVAIPPEGKKFLLDYDVPGVDGPLSFTFRTNEPCDEEEDDFVECCSVGDSAANNVKTVVLQVGRAPDVALVPTRCTSVTACSGANRLGGGPGVTVDPSSSSSGITLSPIQICRETRRDIALPDAACLPPTSDTITEAQRLLYFRVNVSALMRSNGWPESPAQMGAATAVQAAGTPHAGERYLTYPNGGTATDDVYPIQIPVKFELYRVKPTTESGGDPYERVGWLPLAQGLNDGGHAAVAPNCPDGVRRCVQWLSTENGGAPNYADGVTPVTTVPFDFQNLGGDFQFRAYLNGVEPENATNAGCGVNTYSVTVAPDSDCTNNVATFDFRIKAPDIVVDITETDLLTDAYPADGTMSFNGTVTNVGDVVMSRSIGSGTTNANFRFFIDDRAYSVGAPCFPDPQDSALVANCKATHPPLGPGESVRFWVKPFKMNGPGCADETCARFVAPGTRTARVVIDENKVVSESDETNNVATALFLVKDTEAPKLSAMKLVNDRGEELKGTIPDINRGAPFVVSVVVTDTDHQITNVRLKLTKPDGTTIDCPGCTFLNQTARVKNDMTFTTKVPNGLTEVGEWTLTVEATDPSGGVAAPIAKKVKVSLFKKESTWDYSDLPQGGTCVSPPCTPGDGNPFFPKNGTVLDYLSNGLDYTVRPAWTLPGDPRDQHGHLPAWTSKGMRIRVDPPDRNWTDYTVENDSVLVAKSRAGLVTRVGMGNSGFEGPLNFTKLTDFSAASCVAGTNCQRRTGDTKFQTPLAFPAGDIGRYNVTLNLTDVGGSSKEYVTTFEIRDKLPFANMTLRRTGTNPDEGQVVRPGQSIRYRATGHDDQGFEPNGTLHLNFTRIGANWTITNWVNLSMGKPTSACTRVGLWWDCPFERIVKTGTSLQRADLTRAGRWNLTVWSEDKYHNFGKNTTTRVVPASATAPADPGAPLVVFLNDTIPARFNGTVAPYGTLHAEEEVGGTVTFYARVADDLDPDVFLEVKEGANVFADFVKMKGPDRHGNYTYNMTFDAPRNLEYRFKIQDSNATRAPVFSDAKRVSIHANLPPRMDVLLPHVPDHGYFAKAAPALEFKVYDTAQGVNSATIQMTVDGENVTTLEKTLTDNGHGFLVKYTRDPGRPWVHGQKVNVTLEAADLSDPPKLTRIALNFTVDAIAPKSRIVSFEPRYVAKENDLWNVSLTTRFTPTSDDNEDGLPTYVDDDTGIRYQFIRSGPGREFVFNGTPFPMSDLPASQNVGNAEYFVRVLGTDIVGNREIGSTTNTLRVFLDQVPPELVRSKLKTTGRVINATFDDPASGTKGAIVHYRYDAGAWASVNMVKGGDGTWTATIPSNPVAKTVAYYLEATDNVGNRKQFGDEQSPPWSFPIGNRPPSITIVSPANGQTVSGSTTLRWEASDPDGDPLTYRVYYKPTAGRDELELTTLSAGTQSYVLNTQALGPDGQYDIRVVASDGNFVEESSIRLDVVNARAAIDDIAPDRGQIAPGDLQCIRTRITKSNVAVVEADILLNGVKVTTVPLYDNGQGCDARAGDGLYGGGVALDEAGTYDVEIYTRYSEAGEIKETRSRENGLFEVRLSAVDVIGKNPVLFGAFITLGVAVFAVGGFAVHRRWR